MNTPLPVDRSGARSPWAALLAIALGVFLVALDGTITAVANPVLGADLHASLGGLQWITNVYLLALAATLVLSGRLGDRWGRRRIFLVGVIGFGVASAIVGAAPTVSVVVIGRGLQGLAGALIITNAISLLRASFPARQLPAALSAFAAVIGASSAAGPIAGGLLVQHLGWRWAFLINAPFAVLAVVAGLRVLRAVPAAPRAPFDLGGAVLLSASLLAATYGLITLPELGATEPLVLSCLIGSILLGVGFVLVERRAADPLLPLRLLCNRSISAAVALTVLTFFSLVGSLFFVLLMLQQVNGQSPVQAGLHVLPMSIANVVASAMAGPVAARFGVRPPLVAGMLCAAAGFSLFGLVEIDGPFLQLAAPFAVLGFGLGLVMTCGIQAILAHTPEEDTGAASGMHQTANQVGGVLGTAVLGAVMAGTVSQDLPRQLAAAGVPVTVAEAIEGDAVRSVAQGVVPPMPGVEGAVLETVRQAAEAAFMTGLHMTMGVGALVTLLGAGLALLVRNRHVTTSDTVVIH